MSDAACFDLKGTGHILGKSCSLRVVHPRDGQIQSIAWSWYHHINRSPSSISSFEVSLIQISSPERCITGLISGILASRQSPDPISAVSPSKNRYSFAYQLAQSPAISAGRETLQIEGPQCIAIWFYNFIKSSLAFQLEKAAWLVISTASFLSRSAELCICRNGWL